MARLTKKEKEKRWARTQQQFRQIYKWARFQEGLKTKPDLEFVPPEIWMAGIQTRRNGSRR
jgi:hypothetical protein